ncbi:MAG: ATP-dependent Clp protease adaptor ClpS [Epsilonproteobacteria bacterium]|nr:MAG: ATP-dependent Clp protease adaptor ClpS [Campylobacterota bacterium]
MPNKIEYELDIDVELEEPKKYKVLLLNDDYSTMDFVIDVLVKIFRKSSTESENIMLNIHNNGKAVCGIYSHEIASTKVAQVKHNAKNSGFPLKAILEEE